MPTAKTVIIGIGLPAAGKTTHLKRLAEEAGYEYISPDDLRERQLGDFRDQSQNDAVWQQIYRFVRAQLSYGKSVVVDGAGVNPQYRREDIALYRSYGAQHIIGYWFQTPLEECLARNAVRQRPVPEDGLRHFNDVLTANPPQLDEGFDEIKIVD